MLRIPWNPKTKGGIQRRATSTLDIRMAKCSLQLLGLDRGSSLQRQKINIPVGREISAKDDLDEQDVAEG